MANHRLKAKQIALENNLVFFDDDCLICNRAVRFIVKYDHKKHFYFASLESQIAKNIFKQEYSELKQKQSLILYKQKQVFLFSTAVLEIGLLLFPKLRLLTQIALRIPSKLRDPIYRLIARNRRRFQFRNKMCSLDQQDVKERMLID